MSHADTVSIRLTAPQLALMPSREATARSMYYELRQLARSRWGEGLRLEYGFSAEDDDTGAPIGIRFFAVRRR